MKRICRGHSLSLITPFDNSPKILVRNNFFTERVVKLWNELSENVVSAPSVTTFKGRLDTYRAVKQIYPTIITTKQIESVYPHLVSYILYYFFASYSLIWGF